MKSFKMLSLFTTLILLQSACFAQIPTFRDIAAYAGVNNADLSVGAAFIDVNNDGYYDIHLINDAGTHMFDHLYLNQGNLTFRDISRAAGIIQPPFSWCTRVADIDNDGWQDIMVATPNMVDFSRLYHNNGNCTFTDLFQQSGLLNTYYIGCDWGDVNNDGLVDLFLLAEYVAGLSGMWTCTGFATYSLAFNLGGSYAFGCDAQFCDFDFDRDLDLFVGVYGYNRLYENENGTFRDIATAAGVAGSFWDFSFPIIGDYNNDGLFDIFVFNSQEYVNSPDCLYRQVDIMRFIDVIDSSGIDPMAEPGCGLWGDFDNDGWLDLIIFAYLSSHFWHNNGDGTFSDVAHQAGLPWNNDGALGPALGDINNDGFLDIYLPRYDQENRLFVNEGNGNHWLQVCLVGTTSNRLGIGARGKAVAGDLVQWRDLGGGKYAYSSNAPFIHFGLGENTIVDSLYIYWPSGEISTLTQIPVDQRISITEGEDSTNGISQITTYLSNYGLFKAYPNPFNNEVNLSFKINIPGTVKLTVYNIKGEAIVNLIDSFYQSGSYNVKFKANNLASGFYFVKLQTGENSQILKILLLR